MFDTIKRIVADKTQQIEALELIQHVGVPLVKLKVKTASLNGEIEIADGKRIVRARANPGKDTGLQALLRVLSATGCSLELVAIDVIGSRTEELNLKVEEVLADEKAFIERIKHILWPVDADKKVIETHFVNTEEVVSETAEMALQPHRAELGVQLSAAPTSEMDGVAQRLSLPPSEETCEMPALKLEPEENFAPVANFEDTMDLTEALATRGSIPDDSVPVSPVSMTDDVSPAMAALDEEIGLEINDLEDKRKADLIGLDALLSERAEEFQRKLADKIHEEDHAITGERKEAFDRLKEFYEEAPEKFYDKTDLSEMESAEGLDPFKSRILEIVSEESTDPASFEEADPALKNQESIRPIWEPEKEEPPKEVEVEPALVDEYVPPPLTPSPFAEATSDITDSTAFKDKLAIEGTQDDKTLLERRPGDHSTVSVDRDSLPRMKPISKSAYIAAGIALLAVPMFGFGINNYANVQAKADSEETADVRAMVSASVEEQSLANQPQQAFRMPAGGTGPFAPSGGSSPVSGGSGEGEKQVLTYKRSAHPYAPPNGAELEAANQSMRTAERFMASGRFADAARVYADALARCPGYLQLRIAAIRAYMQANDMRNARRLCEAGMINAANEGEFNALSSVYQQIP